MSADDIMKAVRRAAREAHRREVDEQKAWAKSLTPDDYDPAEDNHSAAIQKAILRAADDLDDLDRFSVDDVRRGLNHSNPKVRAIIVPAYTERLRRLVEVADKFRELVQ